MGLINYIKTFWNRNTYVTPTVMNNIEDGVENATNAINTLDTKKVLVFNSKADLDTAIANGTMAVGQTAVIPDGNNTTLDGGDVSYSGSVSASNVTAAINTLNSDITTISSVTVKDLNETSSIGKAFKSGNMKMLHISSESITVDDWGIIGVIPNGYRPYTNLNTFAIVNDNSVGRVIIYSNGNIKIASAITSAKFRITCSYL